MEIAYGVRLLCVTMATFLVMTYHASSLSLAPDDSLINWVDVCKWQTFRADCPSNTVIWIDKARYGRMRLGSCLTTSYGHVGCSIDVTRYLETHCAGRQHCTLQLPDVNLESTQHHCPHELLTYLEVAYHCQPVLTAPAVTAESNGSSNNCAATGQDRQPILISPPIGQTSYLASITTQQVSSGSEFCPWVFNLTQGQLVTLTLIDFTNHTMTSSLSALSNTTNDDVCVIYGEIVDEQQHRVLMCGGGASGQSREQIVFKSSSRGGAVYMTFHAAKPPTSPDKQFYFVVQIDVRCVVSDGDGVDDVDVDCPISRVQLIDDAICVDDVTGESIRCARSAASSVRQPSLGGQPYSNQGILIVIVIGTALLLSVVIIIVGLLYLQRKSRLAANCQSVYHTTCVYDFPPPNTSISAALHAEGGVGQWSDGYHSIHGPNGSTASYKEIYQIPPSSIDREYATTLQMRHLAAFPAYSINPLPPPVPIPAEVWACPVHGHVTLRRHNRPPGDCLYELTTTARPVLMSPSDASPFYHELDPSALTTVTGIRAGCVQVAVPAAAAAAAAAGGVGGGAAGDRCLDCDSTGSINSQDQTSITECLPD